MQTDTIQNLVFSGQRAEHPGPNRQALKIHAEEIHYLNEHYKPEIGESREMEVPIRYRQPLQKSTLVQKAKGPYI